MALTAQQKEQLDICVKNIFSNKGIIGKDKLLREVNKMMKTNDISSISILSSIKRTGINISYNKYTELFTNSDIVKYIRHSDVRKNKSIVNLYGSMITYDFVTKKITNNTNIKYIETDKGLLSINKFENKINTLPEWITNYTGKMNGLNFSLGKLIAEYTNSNNAIFPEKEPKNFYHFFKHYIAEYYIDNLSNMLNLIQLYDIKTKYGNFLYNYALGFSISKAYIIAPYNDEIQKIIKISIDEGEYHITYWLGKITNYIKELSIDNYDVMLDTNRTLKYNANNLYEIKENAKNEILNNNLQTINFINGLIIDDYQIVVPQTIVDLQLEGTMQNNCVGSYYNNSITRGENYIYFIRKANDVKQSYITCRYSTYDNETVEHRYKNNHNVCDNNDLNVIKKIDNLINAKLH